MGNMVTQNQIFSFHQDLWPLDHTTYHHPVFFLLISILKRANIIYLLLITITMVNAKLSLVCNYIFWVGLCVMEDDKHAWHHMVIGD